MNTITKRILALCNVVLLLPTLGCQKGPASQQIDTSIKDYGSVDIENIDLRQTVHQYSEQEKDNKKILAQSWQEFNNYTSDFFSSYRISKELLWNEIQQARKTQRYNKKRLEDLIYDITDSTDFFIVKVVKLFVALFVALGNARFENHIEELQEANRQLKAQARKVMQQSNDVSQTLKSKHDHEP